jgi:hypothetical protein
MPAGARKGERRGGRAKGTPNKFGALRVQEAIQQGKLLPHAALMLIAERSLAMAARFQPERTNEETKEREPNPEHDPQKYGHWLAAAREAYNSAAPYYAPKLAAVAHSGDIAVIGAEDRLDPRQIMWETYIAMRRRGELAQKVVEAPKLETKTGTDSSTSVPEPVEVQEDDADGVAA